MSGRLRWIIIAAVAVLIVGAVLVALVGRSSSGPGSQGVGEEPGGTSVPAATTDKQPVTALPHQARVPLPPGAPFNGCPAEGDGGDRTLNRLKNRDDRATWLPVAFAALEQLAWPRAADQADYDRWPREARAQVDQYNGIPVAIEGYLFGARQSGPESGNCHATGQLDYHVWLTAEPSQDRTHAIVVEPTPRVLAQHPAWAVAALNRLARTNERVRISGWTMFDPEHPDQVGKTRGTIWEIHPVMQIEVQRAGAWVPLENLK